MVDATWDGEVLTVDGCGIFWPLDDEWCCGPHDRAVRVPEHQAAFLTALRDALVELSRARAEAAGLRSETVAAHAMARKTVKDVERERDELRAEVERWRGIKDMVANADDGPDEGGAS